MVPGIHHFENLILWIPLRLGLRDRVWKATNGHSRKLAQLSMSIFSKFWSRDRYPDCTHGSRPRCFTCITEQLTSEVVDMFSQGGDPWPVNSQTRAQKWPNLSGQIWRQCFINRWIQTTLFPIITIAATSVITTTTSAAVIWQSAGWISPIPLRLIISISRLYPTTVNKVWCLQCGQIF